MRCCGCCSGIFREACQEDASARELAAADYADLASQVTVTCATDGNHGRSVAWGAGTFGARCIIYMPEIVSPGRARAIEAYGAQVRRVAGSFDDVVRQAAADAAAQGWHVVPDTAPDNRSPPTRDLMQGYSLMIDEACPQSAAPPSHVFVQGGSGRPRSRRMLILLGTLRRGAPFHGGGRAGAC